jgi:PAS domain S-box-containing protein
MANPVYPSQLSLEAFRSLFEGSYEAIAIHDGKRLVYINRAFAELFGYEPKDLIDGDVLKVIAPESRAAVRAGIETSGEAVYEVVGLHKNGPTFECEVRSRFIRVDGRQLRLGSIRDITELKSASRAREAQRETEELFQATFDRAAVGIVHTTPDGLCFRANPKFCELMDRPVGEVVGSHYSLHFHPGDLAVSNRGYRDVLEGRRDSYSGELRLLRKDREPVWILLNSSLVRDKAGRPKYFVTITQDISDKRNAETKLLDHRMRLFHSSKMSALGVMAGGIAHEINNSLSIIRSYANVLREGVPAHLLENVERIDATAVRITRIVRSLMGFVRESDQEPVVKVALSGIVGDVLSLCELRSRQAGVDIQVPPLPEALALECRPVAISQVLLNLMNNAIDAVAGKNPAGSARWVRISAKDAGENIELWVEDAGPGIDGEIRSRIMEPFFTTKPEGQGTGLGLSISQKIVAGHSGTLKLDEVADCTRFIVQLPRRQPELL